MVWLGTSLVAMPSFGGRLRFCIPSRAKTIRCPSPLTTNAGQVAVLRSCQPGALRMQSHPGAAAAGKSVPITPLSTAKARYS